MGGMAAQMRTRAGAEWARGTSVATVALLGLAPRVQPHLSIALHRPCSSTETPGTCAHVLVQRPRLVPFVPFVPSHQPPWIHTTTTHSKYLRGHLVVVSIQKLPHLFEDPTTPHSEPIYSLPPTRTVLGSGNETNSNFEPEILCHWYRCGLQRV